MPFLRDIIRKPHAPAYTHIQASQILTAIAEVLQVPEDDIIKLPLLGIGAYADVLWLPNKKRVLKITTDTSDADASFIVKQRPDPSLIHVYDVYQLWPHSEDYVIIEEKLTPLSGTFLKQMEHATFYFQGIDITDERAVNNMLQKAAADEDVIPETIVQYIKNWGKVLGARHIHWGEDFHEQNVMMRNHKCVISDLGVSTVPTQRIPLLPL